MEFRLLGPLEVAGADGAVELGGTKQRALLAMLLLHAGEVVSSDRLIDTLWGDSPPLTAGKSIQVYVSRLRKTLADDDRIVTRPPGYVLYVEPDELDLARFEQLVTEARAAPPEQASTRLSEALSLWRGPPLADLEYETFAQPEIARLEEMRLAALEQRIEADLALGRHADLVPELETLVGHHAFRERFRHQLMLALYRSDRQADALDAYQRARRELADGLGLEPSESLKRLEAAILRQDAELALPADAGQVDAGRAPVATAPLTARAVLVAPSAPEALDGLLTVAKPLAVGEAGRELIVASVVASDELAAATARLAGLRDELLGHGLSTRTAAFSSPAAGEDIARLASQEGVDLVLMDAGDAPLGGEAASVLERAPCDVALHVRPSGGAREGAVVVPFGAGTHDWAALELGTWFARATGGPLRLVGAADQRRRGRDASRLLADASLIVQRTAGIVAEPVLTGSGPAGVADAAAGAAVLIVGLSERWRDEGLGRARTELVQAPPAPTLLVRRGSRPGGLAPPETRTRFSWSLAGTAAS
jgi:DNA-binding SARP family transcriptional activator